MLALPIRYVDLYILFESVRALGGIEKVAAHRFFFHIRQILLIPEGAANCAYQLSQCYKRYCLPCHDELVDAVETVYSSVNLYSSTPHWLHARIDVPKTSMSTETVPSKRKSPSRSLEDLVPSKRNGNTFKDDDGDAVLDAETEEERDFLRYPEATQAAVRARMNANRLEPSELRNRLFHGLQSHLLRLDLRNHIIRMWYRNTRQRLNVCLALQDIPACFHDIAIRVFTFLECMGIINFGAIPFMTPFTLRHSIQGEKKKRVCIVGAGITGLIAARQLRSFGLAVSVFEARNRAGGRIFTEKKKFSVPVDLGAMIITGLTQNPVSVLATQTYSEVFHMDSGCPLFDIDGRWVPSHTDAWAQNEYNSVLSATARYRRREASSSAVESMSLGVAFQKSLLKRVKRRKERIRRRTQARLFDTFIEGTKTARKGTYQSRQLAQSKDIELNEPEAQGEDKVYEGNTNELVEEKAETEHNGHIGNFSKEMYSKVASRKSNGVKDETQSNGKIDCKGTIMENSDETSDRIPKVEHPRDDHLVSRLLRWHIANLEYACAAPIESVSLKHWDQDDPYSFQGAHVLLKKGFGPLVTGLMDGLERNIRFRTEVVAIRRSEDWGHVEVETRSTKSDDEMTANEKFDAVLITVPLGVLKDESIKFIPPLPTFKQQAIQRLGTGGLMKVAMEFNHHFWRDNDMFGALRESVHRRGSFYFFWSLTKCVGKPILLGMVAEPVVQVLEEASDEAVVSEAMSVLRRCYPNAPDPVAHAVTRWSKDPYSRGAYTNIPVGSSGADYDELAEPVEPFLFFAGEHTCRTNPTTCASGIISGLREAHRIIDKFGMVEQIADMHAAFLEASLRSDERGEDDRIEIERNAGKSQLRTSKRLSSRGYGSNPGMR